jgi:hypothetical protein
VYRTYRVSLYRDENGEVTLDNPDRRGEWVRGETPEFEPMTPTINPVTPPDEAQYLTPESMLSRLPTPDFPEVEIYQDPGDQPAPSSESLRAGALVLIEKLWDEDIRNCPGYRAKYAEDERLYKDENGEMLLADADRRGEWDRTSPANSPVPEELSTWDVDSEDRPNFGFSPLMYPYPGMLDEEQIPSPTPSEVFPEVEICVCPAYPESSTPEELRAQALVAIEKIWGGDVTKVPGYRKKEPEPATGEDGPESSSEADPAQLYGRIEGRIFRCGGLISIDPAQLE